MSTIANRPVQSAVQVADKLPVATLFRVRRAWASLAAAAGLGLLAAWVGDQAIPVPTASSDTLVPIPLWRVLVMGAAVMPVLGCHSRLAELEEVATGRFRRYQWGFLLVMSFGCATLFLVAAAITWHASVLVIMGRSWVGWCGLALLAGALFGWRQAWSLPALTVVVLVYWAALPGGQQRWWDFSARPSDDLVAVLVSLVLLGIGVFAHWVTPWRRRRLAVWRGRSRPAI